MTPINSYKSDWLCLGSTVVEYLPHNLKIKGLNPATGTRGYNIKHKGLIIYGKWTDFVVG